VLQSILGRTPRVRSIGAFKIPVTGGRVDPPGRKPMSHRCVRVVRTAANALMPCPPAVECAHQRASLDRDEHAIEIQVFMTRGNQATDHVWIVMMKAMRALTRYAGAGIEETGLGLSDFGVLELLLHNGSLPVNTIGPIVDLTPGSISILVDRLVAKDLVSRVESAEDRRVRIVALTPRGKELIVSAFRKHSGQMKKVFSELSSEELRSLEVKLKKVGKRAAALMEQS